MVIVKDEVLDDRVRGVKGGKGTEGARRGARGVRRGAPDVKRVYNCWVRTMLLWSTIRWVYRYAGVIWVKVRVRVGVEVEIRVRAEG